MQAPPARSVLPCLFFALWRLTRVHQSLLRASVHLGVALLTQCGCQGLDSLQALLCQLQHFGGVGAEPFAVFCDTGVSCCAPMCGAGGRDREGEVTCQRCLVLQGL